MQLQLGNEISFRPNTHKMQLERFDTICRENGWVKKGEFTIRANTKPYIIMLNRREIVGYFAIDQVTDNQACFWGFYILPKYRNKGYGQQLLISVARSYFKVGTNCLFCHADIDNKIAQHIYLKYGYLMGKDERLYDGFASCNYPYVDEDGYVFVFMQRVWGEKGYTIKKELENVCRDYKVQK